jgi:hypothetical protein
MTDKAISPLRRRIEDMTIRKLAPKTQHVYVQRVKDFTEFLGRSPATASKEDVRRYQLHLAATGAHTPAPPVVQPGPASENLHRSGPFIFHSITLSARASSHPIGVMPSRSSRVRSRSGAGLGVVSSFGP